MPAKTYRDFGIDAPAGGAGEYRTTCPECSPRRKKKNEKSLSVNLEKQAWQCWHCGWTGGLGTGVTDKGDPDWWKELDRPKVYKRPARPARVVSPEAANERRVWADLMAKRGIPAEVLKANGIDVVKKWIPQTETEEWALAYPYERQGELIDIKYRTRDKHFRTEKDAEKTLYRIDKVADRSIESVIFTEGENDALALEAAGLPNAVSVPGGAPPPDAKNLDSKMAFLEDAYTSAVLSAKSEIVLAVDADAPGQALATELARRLGAARCRQVVWPGGVKDANEMLVAHGAEALCRVIDEAPPMPLDGIVSVRDFRETLDDVYEYGMPPGPSTGWNSVDQIYRPAPGLMTIVTGIPSSGKSRWINALLVNLARMHDARFGLCSPEYKPVHLLASHLTETYVGKTMLPRRNGRMTREEYEQGAAFIDDHIHFVNPRTTSIHEILERARMLVLRYGIRGLVIDPWTEVEISKTNGQSDVDALKAQLAAVQQFLQEYNLHGWVAAHPTKLYVPEGETTPRVPGIYDISGGAQWGNKADFILSIWRDKVNGGTEVQIHSQKVRFQHLGQDGKMAVLQFDMLTGRYKDNSSDGATGTRQWESVA